MMILFGIYFAITRFGVQGNLHEVLFTNYFQWLNASAQRY